MFSLFIFNRHLVFRVKFVGVKLLYKAKKKQKTKKITKQLLPLLNGTMTGKMRVYLNAIFCYISRVLLSKE